MASKLSWTPSIHHTGINNWLLFSPWLGGWLSCHGTSPQIEHPLCFWSFRRKKICSQDFISAILYMVVGHRLMLAGYANTATPPWKAILLWLLQALRGGVQRIRGGWRSAAEFFKCPSCPIKQVFWQCIVCRSFSKVEACMMTYKVY